jgi:hypothetical protein
MAAAVTGSKTLSKDASPLLTAAALTTILALAPENMTVGQFQKIADALSRVPGGTDVAGTKTIGQLLL